MLSGIWGAGAHGIWPANLVGICSPARGKATPTSRAPANPILLPALIAFWRCHLMHKSDILRWLSPLLLVHLIGRISSHATISVAGLTPAQHSCRSELNHICVLPFRVTTYLIRGLPALANMDFAVLVLRRTLVVVAVLTTWCGGMGLALTPDGLALMEFRSALTTISPLLESWNASDLTPCTWGGITCTDSGHVQDIVLPEQVPKLEGHVSASLGKLRSLEVLWLDANMLSGSIPPEIGNLSSLRILSLSFQNFSGQVPLELGNCKSLVQFWLNDNNFTGDITTVLEALSKLPAIEQIGLDNNGFTGTLPPSLGNATTLTYLSLGFFVSSLVRRGTLEGQIPKELGNLVNLATLWLGSNSFSGTIPVELGKLASLQDLDLGYNNLTGEIPPVLGNLTSLRSVSVDFNNLNGSIPSSLGRLLNLTRLGLEGNNFTGEIPPELGNLVRLTDLAFSDNSITGPIPASFRSLTKLTLLALNYNALTGPFPVDLSRTATSVQALQLANNSLSGPIPHDFGKFLPNLTVFTINYNFFNGTLPDGLCQGGNLQWLGLGDNNLEGAIPPSLGSCASLNVALLGGNRFTSVPAGFGSNSSLYSLDISRNQLTGPLPAGLGTSGSLAILDLSENRLTGDMSVLEFSRLAKNLSVLNLAKNNFTGEIPAALAACKLLYRVDLSYNALTGSVPPALANLSGLQELDLQGNNLTALHPSIYSGIAATLRTLDLAGNPWNAPVEPEIGSLRLLQILNLSYGGFTGAIPSALGQLAQLEVLDLSHNSLTGEVPSELGDLMTSLTSVDVSFNRLTGSLPAAWVKFLLADPDSFRGNPGLCLQYNADNMCAGAKRPAGAKRELSVRVIVGVVVGATALAVLACAVVRAWRRSLVHEGTDAEKEVSAMNLSDEPWSLTFDDVMKATDNLSDKFVIGRGAHGVVYKVKGISNTHPCMAVKKIVFADAQSTLPRKSFWAEVKSVGKAKHRNVVRLLGYIKRDEVGLLLYDYLSKGSLHSALHGTEGGGDVRLTWEARLRVAKGVAHGLAYLHHDYDAPVVHRDIKSRNVLLDDDLEARISDFGLAKVLGMQQGSKPWLSTQNAMGTFGYMPPEAAYSPAATPQADVYSYGVLLLELLTGKEPTRDASYGKALHLVAWVQEKVQLNGGRMSESVLDPSLLHPEDPAATEEMLSVQEIALLCTRTNPADRPTMKDVEKAFRPPSKEAEKRNGVGGRDGKETVERNRLKTESSSVDSDEGSDESVFSDGRRNVSSEGGDSSQGQDSSEGRESSSDEGRGIYSDGIYKQNV